jgi:hypothetical protein
MKRRDFVAGLGLLGMVGPALSMNAIREILPEEGFNLKYRVSYGGNEIGHQEVSITEHIEGDHLVIEHTIELEVKILFAVAYSLQHKSTEVWSTDRRLISVEAETIENGDKALVKGLHKEDGFHIAGNYGEHTGLDSLVTSDSFWVASAMQAPMIMNVRTGDLAKPQISTTDDGKFHLKADFERGAVEAKLEYEGNFLKQAEIDSDGHLVKFVKV